MQTFPILVFNNKPWSPEHASRLPQSPNFDSKAKSFLPPEFIGLHVCMCVYIVTIYECGYRRGTDW
jgi:hypothetical protein